MKKIQIITAVDRTPVTSLQGMLRISKTDVRLPGGISWQPIAIKPHAQLSISDNVENGNTVWTAKLVFKTCEESGDRGRWAYRCRLLDGRYRLIGSDERPYPVASVLENMPEKVTDNQLNEVTVNWQSARFIPNIIE
jgi:hypothetical protein